jgi:diacylglycerol kinase (ATP)
LAFKRVAVIFNPYAGRTRQRQVAIDRFAHLLRVAGVTVDVLPTHAPNHATDLAHKAVALGADLVVAYGGDGTMNEVLQALVGTEVALGFWPGGTANVLAAEIAFPSSVEAVVGRILAHRVDWVTVGKANERFFLLMAGIGLDAAVAAGVDPVLKQRLGKGAFALSAMQYFAKWDLSPFVVQMDSGEEIEARFMVAGNVRSYGGGFCITPHAQLNDPYLDLCIVQAEGRLAYVGIGLGAVVGAHINLPGVIYHKVKHVRIVGGKIPVQLDGEVTGTLPLQLEAVPSGVKLLL